MLTSILNFIKSFSLKNLLKLNALVLWVLALSFVVSCKKTDDSLGVSVYNGEVLDANVTEFTGLDKYPFLPDSITTDERSKLLLGSYVDPVFGKVKAHFLAQFLLNSFNADFGNNPVADSVKLRFKCVGYYGTDTTTLQTYKVYRLTDTLDRDASYYSNTDITGMVDLSTPLAEYTTAFDPNSGYLEIPLPQELGNELLNDSSIYADNETFTQSFKGLYLTTEQVSDGGAIYYFSPIAEDGMLLTIYFHNDSLDSLNYSFYITQNSAYFNLYDHDYTGTPVESYLQDSIVSGDYSYIQAAAGVKTIVDVSPVLTFRDSGNVGINKAELILNVDTSSVNGLDPPERLLLEIVDDNDEFNAPVDYFMNDYYFDGRYDATNGTYKFVITQYVQELLKGMTTYTKLRIFPEATKTITRRVVLKNDYKLKIVYTKF